ncbi:MAG: DUF3383 family protein [Clostridia bacterium]|nr:DUF3383 family protein [Clostridia bacterium]
MTISYSVPLSYTINVSLAMTPTGLADFNTNSIAIFSNEAAGFSEPYQAYITPSAVATDFGSDSLTYKMANALFTPVPNFRTGGGMLYIFPFNGVNATSGSFTTPDISANLTAFKSVSNGSLSITIDGNANIVSGLNFTKINTLADIVTVLNGKNLDVIIEAVGNTIKFTSKRFGVASTVEISTITDSGVVDISGTDYLKAASGTEAAGTDASGETLAEAVAAALQQVYFGGVLSTQYVDDTTLLANSSAIQSKDCIYYETIASMEDISSIGASIKSAGNGKTRTLAYSLEGGKVAIATYATIANSVNYSGVDTANTMNLKTLTGVLPDIGLSDTYVLAAANNGVDIYGNTGGLSVVYSNDNNGYTDDIENQLWFKKAIEVAGFNYLRQTNTKIPQTESGMSGLKNAYAQVCEQGIRNGVVGAGAWNSAVPFGDPETFKRNISEKGYYIYSIPVAEQAQAEREQRKAPVVQIAIKFSSAIHFSDVIITVER